MRSGGFDLLHPGELCIADDGLVHRAANQRNPASLCWLRARPLESEDIYTTTATCLRCIARAWEYGYP